MSFDEYLIIKKIDKAAFREAEPERFAEWDSLFTQISEASFTSQKLYLINDVRRKYHLKNDAPEAKAPAVPKARPVIKPRPKIN